MAEAYIVEAVRTPVGRREGRSRRGPSRRPGRACAEGAGRAVRRRPGRRRGRRLRVSGHGRAAGRGHRPDLLAGGRAARGGARGDDRPAVRVLAAGRALRRAGCPVRHPGPGGRGRRPEHDADPHRLRLPPGRGAAGAHGGPVRGQRGVAGAVRGPARQPVLRRRADRREVGDQPAGPGGVRPAVASAGGPGDRRGPLRAGESCRSGTSPSTRGRAGTPHWRRWPG